RARESLPTTVVGPHSAGVTAVLALLRTRRSLALSPDPPAVHARPTDSPRGASSDRGRCGTDRSIPSMRSDREEPGGRRFRSHHARPRPDAPVCPAWAAQLLLELDR